MEVDYDPSIEAYEVTDHEMNRKFFIVKRALFLNKLKREEWASGSS